MAKFILFTARGFEKVKEEKENLLIKRKPAVESLRIAREMGDLSENGAYKAARAELSSIDSRVRHLNKLILLGRIVDTPKTGEIGIGSKVVLSREGKQLEYEIVGSFESDPSEGKISHVSPIGKMLFGKKAGDRVAVLTPNGQTNYQIIGVQ